jgi:hypothetical protein
MKTKCYSVRLESLTSISPKCYKAVAFDGSEDFIPSSQVFGQDYEVTKSDAYWISAWILEKKSIQYSCKKERWFDSETGKMLPKVTIERHIPEKINKAVNTDESLIR